MAVLGMGALLAVAVTAGAFTDRLEVVLGDGDRLGASYNLALVRPGGDLYEANPIPERFNRAGTIVPVWGQGPYPEPVMEFKLITTTKAVGLVHIRPEDDNPAPSQHDPFHYTLFTVRIDGQAFADHVTANQLAAMPITDWEQGVAKAVEVQLSLQPGISDPNVLGRALYFALHIEGRTS
jgi:hypothetical protein